MQTNPTRPTDHHGRAPSPRDAFSRSILLPLLFATGLSAQQTTPPVSPPPGDIIELSPFTVTTTEDRGYQAQSTLGGSRLKTNLKDIASPTTAFTQQFFEDFAITSTDELSAFMLSTEADYSEDGGPAQNRLVGASRPLRMRGLAGGSLAVNFFQTDFKLDTFSTERIDQSRGPNSVLFGIGDPGGIINVTTKRARLDKTETTLAFMAKSHGSQRAELDANVRAVPNRLAFRIAAVDDKTNTWRNHEFSDERRYFGTVKWRIASRTELNAEAELGDIEKATKRTYTAFDGYTLWRDAGRAISATPNAAQGIVRLATTPWIVFDAARPGELMNWRNATTSANRVSADGANIPISDFSILPKEVDVRGPGFTQGLDYSRVSAYLTHACTPDWNLELAGMRTSTHVTNFDAPNIANFWLKVDTNPTLPTGAPNPNVGRTYFDVQAQQGYTDRLRDALRSTMSYRRDLGRWGRHTLAGVYQYDFSKIGQQTLREYIISPNAPNTSQPAQNNNRVFRRTYVDLDGPSSAIVLANFRALSSSGLPEAASGTVYETAFIPFNSSNTQLNSYENTTAIGMLQSSFWRDRIQTVIGASRDRRVDYLSTPGTLPVVAFTNGLITPIRSRNGDTLNANSVSLSGVFHVTKWLGLTYARAENSGLPDNSGILHTPTGRPPTPRGESQDIGFKLDLWDNRLFLTAQYFETSSKRDFDFFGNINSTVNPIWNALDAAGVLAANGMTLDEVRENTTGSTFDSTTQGYEVELTANPSERWRVFLNYSNRETTRVNIGQEMRAHLASVRDFWIRHGSTPLTDASGGTVASQLALVDQNAFSNYILADGRPLLGQMKHALNLRTNFELPGDRLKGVTLGGGARYTSAPVIGYEHTADAAQNVSKQVFLGSAQFLADASIAYRRNLTVFRRPIRWSLQLNVNNVFDNDALIRLRHSSAGELVMYRFNPPREWVLTSRFTF